MDRPPKRSSKINNKTGKVRIRTVPRQPPQFEPTFTVGHRLRYIANSAMSDLIVNTNTLMNQVVVALTTTTTGNLFTAFKLKAVYMWAGSTATMPVTISVEFFGSEAASSPFGVKPKVFSDTSVGQMRNAFLKAKPDPKSSAANWQIVNTQGSATSDTSGAGLILNGPIGTIIDITITYVLQNSETPFGGPGATGPLTVGQIYMSQLDRGAGTQNVQPVGYLSLPA